FDVHADDVRLVLNRNFPEFSAKAQSGVVHQNIDQHSLAANRVVEHFRTVWVLEVGGNGADFDVVFGRQVAGDITQFRSYPRSKHEIMAVFSKFPGEREADAAGSSGDQSCFCSHETTSIPERQSQWG